MGRMGSGRLGGGNIRVEVELVVASYDRQLSGFTTLYTLVTEGRFKSPVIGVMGAKGDDIMVEEMTMFDHDADRKWFGSPEKKKKFGVQDDIIFSINWTIYGGRLLTVDEFRKRNTPPYFGTMILP